LITIENIGHSIILFGRDNNKQVTIKRDDSFRPYFYVPNKNGTIESIDGTAVSKIVVNHPRDVVDRRDKYSKHYEADIIYKNRYIIDKIDTIPKQPIRLCYVDIELLKTASGYESITKANNTISAICCYDSFTEKYIQFCLGVTHEDEAEMLQAFINYIAETDPDIIIGWNLDEFDAPYLINRMNKLYINPSKMARYGQRAFVSKWKTKIFGRVLFDLMKAYKKISQGGRESWSLDYISRYEGLGGKEEFRGELDELFKNDVKKYMAYNKRDVELLVLLNEKLQIIEFFNEIRRLSFCTFEDVFMNSKIADCLCLKHVHGKKVLPSVNRDNPEETFKGAFVHESEPKLHRNIAVMDMASLYPSIMIGFNISYDTYLPKKEVNCINVDNKFFFKKEKGIIPSIVQPLLERRKIVKNELQNHSPESREYKTLWMTQYSLKVIANSFYGVLGFRFFRLYKREVARSVTYIAEKIIREVINWFEQKGHKIIYGDTDSCFIRMDNKSIESFQKMNQEINQYFKRYFATYGVKDEDNIFKLEFEKVFSTVFFKRKADGTGAKKKYVGRIIWDSGKKVDKFNVVGFESKRSDNPAAGRKFLQTVLKMIVYEKEKQEIDDYIKKFLYDVEHNIPIEEIAIPIGINKELESYANTIHARASRNANKLHNAQIKKGDKIKYVYVEHTNIDVIAFKEYMHPNYKINYKKMKERLVHMKIKPIYNSLGWNYNLEDSEKRTLQEFIK